MAVSNLREASAIFGDRIIKALEKFLLHRRRHGPERHHLERAEFRDHAEHARKETCKESRLFVRLVPLFFVLPARNRVDELGSSDAGRELLDIRSLGLPRSL